MARHTFIQMTKIHDVGGRIGYITSVEKQEFLYVTYDTAEPVDEEYWKSATRSLAVESWRTRNVSCVDN